jgi:hypothetical protein
MMIYNMLKIVMNLKFQIQIINQMGIQNKQIQFLNLMDHFFTKILDYIMIMNLK